MFYDCFNQTFIKNACNSEVSLPVLKALLKKKKKTKNIEVFTVGLCIFLFPYFQLGYLNLNFTYITETFY